MEKAFDAKQLEYQKTRAARLFLNKSHDPDTKIPDELLDNFEKLFAAINERFPVAGA